MWLTNIDWLLFIFSTAEMIWAMQKLLIYLLFFGAIMHDIYFEEKRDWVISGSCGSGGKVGRLVVRRLLVWIPDSPATVYLLLSAHRSALSASVSGKIFFPTRLREEGRKEGSPRIRLNITWIEVKRFPCLAVKYLLVATAAIINFTWSCYAKKILSLEFPSSPQIRGPFTLRLCKNKHF